MAKDFFEHVAKRFPPKVLAKAKARYQELRREMLLRELRQTLRVPQSQLARASGIKQSNLSRLEKQSDMQIATLRKIVTALGGKLEVIARFQDADVRIKLPPAA
jgi:transcriptional regulator with XRE-family HTH domain